MRVFIASTFLELKDYRYAAARTIEGLGHQVEMVEKYRYTDRKKIADICKSILRTCHACVLIIGREWGSGLEPQKLSELIGSPSYTMIEFREAVKANIPVFSYWLADWMPRESGGGPCCPDGRQHRDCGGLKKRSAVH